MKRCRSFTIGIDNGNYNTRLHLFCLYFWGKSIFSILKSSCLFVQFFQKLRIQIQSRRNWRIPICDKTGRSDVKCDGYCCCTQCSIAFCIVAKQTHLHRTGMQFRRQQTGCSIYAKHQIVCFFALGELHHFVQRFPSPIEHELHRNKCDLVRGNDLSLQCFDFLLFH